MGLGIQSFTVGKSDGCWFPLLPHADHLGNRQDRKWGLVIILKVCFQQATFSSEVPPLKGSVPPRTAPWGTSVLKHKPAMAISHTSPNAACSSTKWKDPNLRDEVRTKLMGD